MAAPNDEMREIFIDEVLQSLPGEYKSTMEKWVAANVPRADALKEIYEAYRKGDLPSLNERLSDLVQKK